MSEALAHASDAPSARAVEARFFAPCCWGGTLDVHESELARELRHEIEARLSRGETAQSIQDDFVLRFGERVVANRSDTPIVTTALIVIFLAACAGFFLIAKLRRWVHAEHGRATAQPPSRSPDGPSVEEDAKLEARLDEELARLS